MNTHGFIVKNGQLQIGSFNVSDIAKKYGTPLYLMDEARIRNQMKIFKNHFKHDSVQTAVCYASKAFLCKAMAKLTNDEGLYIDTVSGGELYTVLEAGFNPDHIVYHGNNKTHDEIEYGIASKVGFFVLDNIEEIEQIEKTLNGRNINVLLRVNPGVEAKTHKYIQTTTLDSKFGLSLANENTLNVIKRLIANPNINFKGLHAHIGSQILNADHYNEELEAFFKAIKQFKDEGIVINTLNLGGGFGVSYTKDDVGVDLEKTLPLIIEKALTYAKAHDVTCPMLMIEPGRSIVAESGLTLYKVGSVKTTPNKKFVLVDGSFQDSIRASLYQAKYEAICVDKCDQEEETGYTIAGRACESGDIIVHETNLVKPEVNDIVAVFVTGAYHYSMANNYNRFTKPAVVFVDGDKDRVVVKRETYEDLVRNDI